MVKRKQKFLKTVGSAMVERGAVMSTYLPLASEAEQLVVERVKIPLPNLPAAFDGFKIVLMSDFHLYPLTKLPLVERSVKLANSLKPDLTVLTGDYVWWEAEAIADLAPALSLLNARHGVFASMGNHDVWTNEGLIKSALQKAGLGLLINRGVSIGRGQSQLFLAGIDDGWSGQPDLGAALAKRPQNATTVLLAHEPDLADQISLDGRIDVQLSGHTHGGQVRLPNVGALTLPHLGKKYDQGLYMVNSMWVYTTRGIGSTLVPTRINCPPEVSELILVRA